MNVIFLLYVFAVAAEMIKIIIIAAVEDRQQTEKRQ